MWNLFKKLFRWSYSEGTDLSGDSIFRIVNDHSLNRRKNFRVKYPHLGAIGPFPRVFHMNSEMNVANISVGGMLIIDDTEAFGTTIGDTVMLELEWEDLKIKLRCRLVSAMLQRRHLQFIDFSAPAFLKLSKLVKPGHLGSQFRRVRDESGQLEALEFWLATGNETLIFNKTGPFAELNLGEEKLLFNRGTPTVYEKDGKAVTLDILHETLVLISNLHEPSAKVKELIELIDVELQVMTPKKTGTHG